MPLNFTHWSFKSLWNCSAPHSFLLLFICTLLSPNTERCSSRDTPTRPALTLARCDSASRGPALHQPAPRLPCKPECQLSSSSTALRRLGRTNGWEAGDGLIVFGTALFVPGWTTWGLCAEKGVKHRVNVHEADDAHERVCCLEVF